MVHILRGDSREDIQPPSAGGVRQENIQGFFGGWRQIQPRLVRIRVMADDQNIATLAWFSLLTRFQDTCCKVHMPNMVRSPWLPRLVGNYSRLGSVWWLISHSDTRSCIFFHIVMDKIAAQRGSYLTPQSKEEADRCHKLFKQITICWRCCCSWLIHPSEITHNSCAHEGEPKITLSPLFTRFIYCV